MRQIAQFLLAVLMLSSGLTSCYFDFDDDGRSPNFSNNCEEGFGSTITEELNLSDFTGIELNIDAQVYLEQGDDVEILVKGQENIIDELETRVRNEVWEIEFDDCVDDSDVLRIYITAPNLNFIANNGSGKIQSDDILQVEDLELKNNGSGKIQLSVEADIITARNTGSGKVEIEGVTATLDADLKGSGDLLAFDLLARDGQVEVDGSGDAQVNISDFLEIMIEGSGDVYYKGQPDLKVTTRGSGKVFRAD
ncbi:MAG: head GIN domain-containing protein [Bacteroidota bacterium]